MRQLVNLHMQAFSQKSNVDDSSLDLNYNIGKLMMHLDDNFSAPKDLDEKSLLMHLNKIGQMLKRLKMKAKKNHLNIDVYKDPVLEEAVLLEKPLQNLTVR